MTTSLPDVNVLVALLDATHIHHRPAMKWFMGGGNQSWLTCPITQMGPPRIISGPKYSSRLSPASVVMALRQLIAAGGHKYVPADIQLLESGLIDPTLFTSSGMVTDSYLLALAVKNAASLVTFDKRLAVDAVAGGAEHLRLLPDW